MHSVTDLQKDFAEEYQSDYPKGLTDAYELLECLSRSELCETVLAIEKSTGKKVVAKCYFKGHPYFDETEPRQMQGLSFDGIPAYEGEYSGEFLRCILREYVPGENLWDCPRMFFSRDFICKVGIKLCRILEYLHGQNPPVIHRDIKPRNVILKKDGGIALIDFGISRLYGSDKTSDTRVSATRNFAPPEQYGFGQTDERSDIYSLGMLLSWMLTGEERAIDKPKDRLERILHKCTAFSPGKRYSNAKKVRVRLEKYLLQKNASYGRTMAGAVAGVAFCLLVGWTGWEISHAMEMAGVDLPWSDSENGEGPGDGQQGGEGGPEADLQGNVDGTGDDLQGSANGTGAGQQGGVPQTGQTGQEAGTTDAGEAYTFVEPLIEKAVRCELGRPEGVITGKDLLDVREILIIGDEVFSNQFDYGQRKNRWGENVVYGDIKSLEDLKAMPNLEYIYICRQKLRDVSPLASLSKAREIEFLANRITDISPIQNLSKLEAVDFSENEISDISPISGKKYLWRVGFGENPVEDISPLAECRYLRDLILCSASASFDGAPLADIDGFNILDINNTDTDAYRYLSGKSVDMLKLGAPDQKDLECIRDMAYVRELYLHWSHVTDISGIEGREDITYLNMEGCIIDDLSPVFTLPNLKKVVLSLKIKKEMEKLLAEYPEEVPFTVEYR